MLESFDTIQILRDLHETGFWKPSRVIASSQTSPLMFMELERPNHFDIQDYIDFVFRDLTSFGDAFELLSMSNPGFKPSILRRMSTCPTYHFDYSKGDDIFFLSSTLSRILSDTKAHGVTSERARDILSTMGIRYGKTTFRSLHVNGTFKADFITDNGYRTYLLSSIYAYADHIKTSSHAIAYFADIKSPFFVSGDTICKNVTSHLEPIEGLEIDVIDAFLVDRPNVNSIACSTSCNQKSLLRLISYCQSAKLSLHLIP